MTTIPGTLTVAALKDRLHTSGFNGLVVLIGAAASGKSTLAAAFEPEQVSCLDHYRYLTSGHSNDQLATGDAVDLQRLLLAIRLRRGRMTVVDSTNVESHVRRDLLTLARHFDRPALAVVLDTTLNDCLIRNAARPPDLRVPEATVRWQHEQATASRPLLPGEGFLTVLTVTTTQPATPTQESA